MDDIDVYEILVREHEAMLAVYVYGLVGDRALADDVCQEAFVQGYRHLARLERRESFAAWLRTIARNIAFDHLRRRERTTAMEPEAVATLDAAFARLDRHAENPDWAERLGALRACFDELSAPLQATCRMHYYNGVPTAAIAEHLGTSLVAVLKRLQRGREALAACIGKRLRLDER
ncbi:MAG TPA: RNA polymerase sigma factor [Planctomycetota bacterium]|nr:RNA polymerase sigma factor [Planctomycetota bacterium]